MSGGVVSTTASRVSYAGNGATTAFSFPYPYLDDGDLTVVLVDDDGSESTKTLNTHYTVVGAGLSNGVYDTATVTMTTAPASGETLVIFRAPALTQEFNFSQEGNVLPALTRAFGLNELKLQRFDNARSRSVRLSEGVTDTFSGVFQPAEGYLFCASDGAGGFAMEIVDEDGTVLTPPTPAVGPSIRPESFNARGDGIRGVTGVATSSDATFTDANASWTTADVGKAIVIQGAGTAGAAHATTIASINSATSIELTAAAATTVASSAEYVYGTDDTTAFEDALATMGIGDALELSAGKIYCVTNIILPVPTDPTAVWSASHKANSIFCAQGKAEISIIGGGDDDYGVAPTRWVNNSAFGQQPWEFSNVHFHGNKLVDALVVVKSFATQFYDCRFEGAKVDDCRLTRQNKDASNGTSASDFLSECGWWRCTFSSTGSQAGLHVQGRNGSPLTSATDGFIVDCAFTGNATTPKGILLGNAGGWRISGNHVYNHTTYGFDVLTVANIGSFHGNVSEKQSRITLGDDAIDPTHIGPGNSWWTGLTIEYIDDTASQTLVIHGDAFTEPSGGGTDAQLTMTTTHDEKVLVVQNCSFMATTPIVITTAGTVLVEGGRDGSGDMGYQYWADGATGGPDLNLFRRSTDTAANNDTLARLRFLGLNASDAIKEYFNLQVIIANAGAGTEAGFLRISRMTGGSLTSLFDWRSGLTYTGGADPGTGNFNAQTAYHAAGTKVVGTQGSAIANLAWTYSANDPATTPNSAVTFADGTALVAATAYEAFDEIEAKINAILAALRTHGLIAT